MKKIFFFTLTLLILTTPCLAEELITATATIKKVNKKFLEIKDTKTGETYNFTYDNENDPYVKKFNQCIDNYQGKVEFTAEYAYTEPTNPSEKVLTINKHATCKRIR